MNEFIKIQDVSGKYDITARTLRYYEDMGLIISTRNDDVAHRLYDEHAIKRIEQILILRKLNISIKDIQRIFNTVGSEVVLEVLGKKVSGIDDEVASLHELKKILLDFISQIKQADFHKDSDVKLLYDKAKEIETQLTNVDYIGKPSNVGRLLEAAEKLEREPDILVVDMPPSRMVTSGPLHYSDKNGLEKYEAMLKHLRSRIADKINPREFKYHLEDPNINPTASILFLLEDWMTLAETEGYEIITFSGGLFATAVAETMEWSEYLRILKGIKTWLTRQERLEIDEEPGFHGLYQTLGEHPLDIEHWNYGKVRYFIPIKIKGK
jgi:DNA-binding transcriptional MerR regulator